MKNQAAASPRRAGGWRLATVMVIINVDSSALAEPIYGSISPESSPASDAFAAAHLALILTVFLGFAAFAWVLHRRAKSPNQEREFIEDLLAREQGEAQDKERRRAGGEAEEPLEPWEKSGDWWKKDP